MIPGPSSVTSDLDSPGHQALYFQCYSQAHLAGASRYPNPSDCHFRAMLGSTSLNTPVFQSPPSLVLATHHTCDCLTQGSFPSGTSPSPAHPRHPPASVALPAQPPELVLPGVLPSSSPSSLLGVWEEKAGKTSP